MFYCFTEHSTKMFQWTLSPKPFEVSNHSWECAEPWSAMSIVQMISRQLDLNWPLPRPLQVFSVGWIGRLESKRYFLRGWTKIWQAFGSIIGNYLSGWWNGKAGPESTYLCTAAVPIMSLLFASVCLRETNKNIKQDVPIREATIKEKPSASKSYLKLLSDPECCLLAGALGLYEFMNYPPLNSVSILFMKERFHWGPLEAGRFASGHALAVFSGSLLAGRLIQVFGKQLYVSLTNLLTAVAFLTWATASNGWSLVASLLPLSFGTGDFFGAPQVECQVFGLSEDIARPCVA